MNDTDIETDPACLVKGVYTLAPFMKAKVPGEGVGPSRLASQDFKSCVYAISPPGLLMLSLVVKDALSHVCSSSPRLGINLQYPLALRLADCK